MAERVGGDAARVLDLCCGRGALAAALQSRGAEVVGLDCSPEMLARARSEASGVRFVEGDATAPPFDDASFDAVVCAFGMMHLPDQPRTLSEIARILRPGGRFVMTTWAAPDVSPAFGVMFGSMRAHADFSSAPAQPDLFAFARPDSAESLLAEAGLRLVARETLDLSWRLDRPDALYEVFAEGAVAAGMLLRAQSDETRAAIRGAVAEKVAAGFADGVGYSAPVPVVLLEASR